MKGGSGTLGVRIPDDLYVWELVTDIDAPIVGTSANYPGQRPPFAVSEIDSDLASKVDGVLSGLTKQTTPSTVVDCTSKPWKILRQGSVIIE